MTEVQVASTAARPGLRTRTTEYPRRKARRSRSALAAKVDNERRVQRDAILRIATEEFGARGYRSTNLSHVASRLGVTRQALYHYFSHKHDILVTLFLDYFDELEANLRTASAGAGAADSFRAMMRAHVALMAARPWISRVFEREDGQIPKRAANGVRARRRALHQLFVEAYEAGVRAGALRDLNAKLVVSTLLGVAGWLHRWYRIDGRLSPDEFAAYAEDVLFGGLRADGHRGN